MRSVFRIFLWFRKCRNLVLPLLLNVDSESLKLYYVVSFLYPLKKWNLLWTTQNSLLILNRSIFSRFRILFSILINVILILNPESIIFTGYKLNNESKLIMWLRKTITSFLWDNILLGKWMIWKDYWLFLMGSRSILSFKKKTWKSVISHKKYHPIIKSITRY